MLQSVSYYDARTQRWPSPTATIRVAEKNSSSSLVISRLWWPCGHANSPVGCSCFLGGKQRRCCGGCVNETRAGHSAVDAQRRLKLNGLQRITPYVPLCVARITCNRWTFIWFVSNLLYARKPAAELIEDVAADRLASHLAPRDTLTCVHRRTGDRHRRQRSVERRDHDEMSNLSQGAVGRSVCRCQPSLSSNHRINSSYSARCAAIRSTLSRDCPLRYAGSPRGRFSRHGPYRQLPHERGVGGRFSEPPFRFRRLRVRVEWCFADEMYSVMMTMMMLMIVYVLTEYLFIIEIIGGSIEQASRNLVKSVEWNTRRSPLGEHWLMSRDLLCRLMFHRIPVAHRMRSIFIKCVFEHVPRRKIWYICAKFISKLARVVGMWVGRAGGSSREQVLKRQHNW